MANLIIKPASGGSLVLQDEGGDAAVTVGTTGNTTLAGTANALGTITHTGTTWPSGHILQAVHNYINDTHSSTTTDFVWDDSYTNVTAKAANSSYILLFNGNYTPSDGTNEGDSIMGFGFAVDPAGGTSWTYFGGGTNTSHTSNIKFFTSRLDNAGGGSFDGYYLNNFNGHGKYTSSVAAGVTLRFAIRYLAYGNFTYNINKNLSAETGASTYNGNSATAITVLEVAA